MNPRITSESGSIFDRQGLIDRVKERCAPIEALLEETGDTLDYDNLRFFTSTGLNGADETVVSVFLTLPLADLVPLPLAVLLPLDPCTAFHSLENGIPYLYRILSYKQAELVNAKGEFIRYSTSFSWENRGSDTPEPEWHKYLGNYKFHFFTCGTVSTNQAP